VYVVVTFLTLAVCFRLPTQRESDILVSTCSCGPKRTDFFIRRIEYEILTHSELKNVTYQESSILEMPYLIGLGHGDFKNLFDSIGELGSSVSTGSGYGLDDRVIEFRSPAEAKDFPSSLCIRNGSGAHPASCTLGTGGPFRGAKLRQRPDADHLPHLVPRSRMRKRYTSSPPKRLHGV
jgi:hypothetical protein